MEAARLKLRLSNWLLMPICDDLQRFAFYLFIFVRHTSKQIDSSTHTHADTSVLGAWQEAQQLNQSKGKHQMEKARKCEKQNHSSEKVSTLVVVVGVGVACDKLQKITCYIVNNNKYIHRPVPKPAQQPFGPPAERDWGKLHVVFQHQQKQHQQQQQHRLIPGNENLYKFEKSDNILLLLAIKTT